MAITLIEQAYPIRRVLSGSDSVVAVAGSAVRIRVGDNDILAERVPAGKTWRVIVTVKVEETNA